MNNKRRLSFLLTLGLIILNSVYSQISEQGFKKPDIKYRPVPLWFWNNSAVEKKNWYYSFV